MTSQSASLTALLKRRAKAPLDRGAGARRATERWNYAFDNSKFVYLLSPVTSTQSSIVGTTNLFASLKLSNSNSARISPVCFPRKMSNSRTVFSTSSSSILYLIFLTILFSQRGNRASNCSFVSSHSTSVLENPRLVILM